MTYSSKSNGFRSASALPLLLPLLALTACGSSETKTDGSVKRDVAASEVGTRDGGSLDSGGGTDATADAATPSDSPMADGAADAPADVSRDAPPADRPADLLLVDGPAPDTRVADSATPDAPNADAAAPDSAGPDGESGDVHFNPDVGDEDIAREAEDLDSTGHGGPMPDTAEDPRASAGVFVFFPATKVGDSVDFVLPEVAAGTYQLVIEWKGNSSRGIAAVRVDGTVVGSPLDQYTADEEFTTTPIGNVTLTAADHTVSLTVTGKNAASDDFTLAVDRIVLVKQ
jgi:hypothetical protein